MEQRCNECGSTINESLPCRDYLNEMIKWDFEDFLGVGQIHHLTVICYQLQHPSLYSQKGLEDAKNFLIEFIDKNATYEDHDKRNKERLSSSVRDWKITSTPEDYGRYINKVHWEMTAEDVVKGGLSNYVENIKKWSKSILHTLKESDNLS